MARCWVALVLAAQACGGRVVSEAATEEEATRPPVDLEMAGAEECRPDELELPVPRTGPGACQWRNPDSSGNEYFGFGLLNYSLRSRSGQRAEAWHVGDAERCGDGVEWYAAPDQRTFGWCPAACERYLADPDAAVWSARGCPMRRR